MSAGELRRHTFVVVEQGDGQYHAYEENKNGPASKIQRVPAVSDRDPYRAIARLCEVVASGGH